MGFRPYDRGRDREAAHRIWEEVGWLEDEAKEAMDILVDASRAMVAEVDGSPECLVLTTPGTMRYLNQDIPFVGVTGVTTSRVARKRGLAKGLTALSLALEAADGAAVAGLGMFDQGFYNALGFGTGSYEHGFRFDPAHLRAEVPQRVPRRITKKDWADAHAARLCRFRRHGEINLRPAAATRSEMLWQKKGFGLGYADGVDGALSHYIWCDDRGGEHGPYAVRWCVYETREQFWELMGLLKSLGDQVHWIEMGEPPGIQLQDLLHQPFKQQRITRRSAHPTGSTAAAWWQMRICDLPVCLAHTCLDRGEVHFNLHLWDPIEAHLDDDAPWRGVGGEYVVFLGPHSRADRGRDTTLPTMTTTVNAFTRLWLGVCPASSLAITDDLQASAALLDELDRVLRLPQPHVGWEL
ncbi:MAG: GNAT family N-acetyltransferase [Chloroflexota bacterium]